MSFQKVAIVTGANKGIGLAIAKGLCHKFQGTVYITARNTHRGVAAVKALEHQGLSPKFHQLDIDDKESIKAFAEYIKTKHGGIDVLVNNAAIAFTVASTEPVDVQAEKTIETNYFGTLQVCETLFPLLKENARVIHISSSAGHLSHIPGENIRQQFAQTDVPISHLSDLMKQYMKASKEGTNESLGWGKSSYTVSKVGLSALARVQQAQLDKESPTRNISVNSVHPGYVDTDLSSHTGPMSPEEGAEAALFLSLEAQELKGQFIWFDSSVVDWLAPAQPAIFYKQ